MRLLKFSITKKQYFLLFPLSFVLILIIWSILSYIGIVKPYFLPNPIEVFSSAIKLVTEDNYIYDIFISTKRILTGFILSCLLGIPLGILLGINRNIEAAIEPFIDFIRYMPVAGFIPLSILWFGIGNEQKIVIIFIGTFFQLVPMVMNSVSKIPSEYLDTSRTLGLEDFAILKKVIIPYSLPFIYDSMRISIGLAWTYLVIVEIVAAGSGIGHMIVQSQRYLITSNIFVGIATVGILGLITDYTFKLMKPKFFPYFFLNSGDN